MKQKNPTELSNLVTTARSKAPHFVTQYKERKQRLLKSKIDVQEKHQIEKEVSNQKSTSNKEALLNELSKIGGLWATERDVDKHVGQLKSSAQKVAALKTQIEFRKTVLGQTHPKKENLQFGSRASTKLLPFSS